MKQPIVFFCAVCLLACNNEGASKIRSDSAAATSTTAINYPYAIDHPDNWERGNTANAMIALNSLKAWELGKMDESLKYFDDSVWVEFDALDKKMPNDSLKAMFSDGWNSYKSVDIKMYDWESVVSKDKKEEWVTLWYTQHWETKKGIKDSAAFINDLQIKNGKIVRLDEYTRKLH